MDIMIATYLTFCVAAFAYMIRVNLIIAIRLRATNINPAHCLHGPSTGDQLWMINCWTLNHFYPDLIKEITA